VRKGMSLVGIALAGGCLGVLAAPAGATPPAPTVLTVTGTLTSFHPRGGAFELTERLSQGQKVVGNDDVTCAFSTPTTAQCFGRFIFTGRGDLFVEATDFGSTASGTILGGTQSFAGAHGTFALVDTNPQGTKDRETFTYTL
jgi:hypothetical protein